MPLLIIISYILTFFTHYNLRTDDLNIYIPYITHLFDGARLGSQYDYQGFYWVIAIINKAFYRLFPSTDLLPIGVIVTSTSFILFVFLLLTFIYIKKWLKQFINKEIYWLYFLVGIYTLSQFWYIAYPSYGNTFRRLSVVWILLALFSYLKHHTWKYIYIMSFFMLTLVNFSSTGIFLSFFLLYAISHLFAYLNEDEMWLKLWVLSIPFSIWSVLFKFSFIVVVLAFHSIMSLLYFTHKLDLFEKLWKKYHTYILLTVPIVFVGLTFIFPETAANRMPWLNFFSNPEFEMLIHYLRFDNSNLRFAMLSISNIIIWFSVLISFASIRKIENKDYKAIVYLILVIIITFFNPWVARFVISNFTYLAYFRIYDILFNPVTFIVYFSISIIYFKQKYFQKVILILVSLSMIIGIYYSDLWVYLDFSDKLDRIHHVSKNEIEVFNQLEIYVENENIEEPINIVVQIYAAHLLTDLDINRQTLQRIDNIHEIFSKDDSDSKLNQIFMIKTNELQYGTYVPPFSETCSLLKEAETQFVIVEAQYNWDVENGLGYCGEKIYEVGDYRVFRMRYEWLDD